MSSPSRNVTVRRRGKARRHHEHRHSKRKRRSSDDSNSSADSYEEEELITHHVLDDVKVEGDDESRSLVLAPTASLSDDDEYDDEERMYNDDAEQRRPSPVKRRITDEHDIAACRQATRGLQSELPQCSPGSESESPVGSSEVKPVELFHSPQTTAPNEEKSKRSWAGKLHGMVFAMLGLLELGNALGYFSASAISERGARIVNNCFLFVLVVHHIGSAKTAAFAYASESSGVTKRSSRRSFDPSDSKRNSKQNWNGERAHLFLSFLLFRAIILLPVFTETSSGAIATRASSIAEVSLMRARTMLSEQMKQVILVIKSYISKEIVALALTNPLKLRLRLRQLATYIRWTKFLAPLIGTLNKLKSHCIDLHRKWSQHRRSRRARLLWDKTLCLLRAQSRFDAAVLRIQRNFRRKREIKSKTRMNLMKDRQGKTQSSRMIHLRLRREATQARLGIAKIDKIHAENSKRRMISAKDKRQMVEYKDGERGRRVFLLKPNSNFAVLWKFVTVACVLLEVISMSLAPRMTGEIKRLDVQAFARLCAASIHSNDPTIWKRLWAVVAAQLAEFLATAVPFVSFASVFVEFFTGELSDKGLVVPKSFFSRWIIPGVFLQLLVNPSMRSIARNAHISVLFAQSIGLARVASLVTAFLPLLEVSWNLVVEVIHRFIEMQNRSICMFA